MARIYPPRKPKEVVGVTLRIREELRRRIEFSAKKNHVSLNAEIERRLHSSFELQNTASLIRVLVGGEVTADLLGAIARVFDLGGTWMKYREGSEAAKARREAAYVALIIVFTELLSTPEHVLDPSLASKPISALRRGGEIGEISEWEGFVLAQHVLNKMKHEYMTMFTTSDKKESERDLLTFPNLRGAKT
jgi:Arc-like DNA binding domain